MVQFVNLVKQNETTAIGALDVILQSIQHITNLGAAADGVKLLDRTNQTINERTQAQSYTLAGSGCSDSKKNDIFQKVKRQSHFRKACIMFLKANLTDVLSQPITDTFGGNNVFLKNFIGDPNRVIKWIQDTFTSLTASKTPSPPVLALPATSAPTTSKASGPEQNKVQQSPVQHRATQQELAFYQERAGDMVATLGMQTRPEWNPDSRGGRKLLTRANELIGKGEDFTEGKPGRIPVEITRNIENLLSSLRNELARLGTSRSGGGSKKRRHKRKKTRRRRRKRKKKSIKKRRKRGRKTRRK
jgi:hypothetical protein